MDQYIRYHKKPYAKYETIKEFNDKFGTKIPQQEEYEKYFKWTFKKARLQEGPDEFLQAKLYTQEEFEEMGWKDKLAAAAKKAKGVYEKGKKKAQSAAKKARDLIKSKKEENLDALLSDNEDVVEEEYEEKMPITNIVTEKKRITDIVLESSADSETYTQDMKHLIQFRNTSIPLKEQLMKGRPKYLKAIKAYVNGDNTAEVKMSWRDKNKSVKIADLNPKIDSLKALLRTSPGGLRIVECV